MLALTVLTWKVKPIINPSPEISVSIISDVASSVGNDANEGDTTQEIAKATSPEPEPETKQEIAPEPAPAPIAAPPPPIIAPKPKPQPKAPPPPPIAQPKVQPKAPPPPAPAPKQIARPQPAPAPIPKKVAPPPRAQTAPAPSATRPSPPVAKAAPANTNPFGNFDLAAATRAASGVDAGGRRAPQMAKSSGSANRGRGQGTRLQGDLANALRQQIKPCWREPADLSHGQSLVVVVAMELREDGNLARPPRLVSPASRNGANSSLLVAIDNALRAARQCAPYDLPADRYDDWKTFEFRFDPRELRSP